MQQKKRKINVSTCILVLFLLSQSVRHTIKGKCSSGIKCTSNYQQRNLHNLQKTKDKSGEGYDSDGEPGPFFDMKYLEYNQYFDEDALPDIVPLDYG